MIEVTAGVIKRDDGKILIARRKQGLHLEGFWEFPGGKVELNEIPENCLKREIKEELNIDIDVKSHIVNSYFNYGTKEIVLIGFFAEFKSGNIVLKDHDDFHWIDLCEIVNFRFAPADLPIINKIVDGI
jgi:8-oxo-dGTP diphosphatase